jgi:hypothetical protein
MKTMRIRTAPASASSSSISTPATCKLPARMPRLRRAWARARPAVHRGRTRLPFRREARRPWRRRGPPIPAPMTTACVGLPMDAVSAGAISGRPRRRANAGHGERNPLRKNFRDRILSYTGNVAGLRERMDGTMVRERLRDVPPSERLYLWSARREAFRARQGNGCRTSR